MTIDTPVTGHDDPATAGMDLAAFSRQVARDLEGQYTVRSILGQGAFATVARVVESGSDEVYALKCFHGGGTAASLHNFYRELRQLFRLQHPRIVNIHNTFEVPGAARYLLLQYCAGGNLRRYLSRHCGAAGPPSDAWLAAFLEQMVDALAYAHEQGVAHLDLKPENILFAQEPSPDALPSIMVADFGLARRPHRDSQLEAQTVSGSPAYMAPEQFAGQVSHGSDYYSLGVVLYELLHGRRPFYGDFATLRQQHTEVAPAIASTLPGDTRRLLGALLQKDPASRLLQAQTLLLRHTARMTATARSVRWQVALPAGHYQRLEVAWRPDGTPACAVVVGPETTLQVTADGAAAALPSPSVSLVAPVDAGRVAVIAGRQPQLVQPDSAAAALGNPLDQIQRILGCLWRGGLPGWLVLRGEAGLWRLDLTSGEAQTWAPSRRARRALAVLADGQLAWLQAQGSAGRLIVVHGAAEHTIALPGPASAICPVADTDWLVVRLDAAGGHRRILVCATDGQIVPFDADPGLPVAVDFQSSGLVGLLNGRTAVWWNPQTGVGRYHLDRELTGRPTAIAVHGSSLIALTDDGPRPALLHRRLTD